MKNVWLYLGVLSALAMLVLVSLGEGFWGGGNGIHWTNRLMADVCHQMPNRSFRIADIPMAVNTRCFGVFAGLLAGWLLILPLKDHLAGQRWLFWLLIAAVILQAADVAGNIAGLWSNTNLSRFFTGSLLGITAGLLPADRFSNRT